MKDKPNVIYVYADDLGVGTLSCYGQKHYKTPNIDRLCNEGMKFNRAYGCVLCAPARASLITGYHDCHAGKWMFNKGGIYKDFNEGKLSLEEVYELVNNSCYQYRKGEVFLPQIFKEAGYVTGEIGKLEWGFATTEDDINKHGWDYHYGYYDHQLCHGFYPPTVFENGKLVTIEGNTHPDCGKNPEFESEENYKKRWDMTGKVKYSQDLFNEKIVEFIEKNRSKPFFLFHPSQLPHGPVSVPNIHEGVKDADELTQYEKEYASMVLRLDDTVGIITDTLKKYNLLENTIIVFSSDNGYELHAKQPGRNSSTESIIDGKPFDEIDNKYTTEASGDVFNGTASLTGHKRSTCEGGVRIAYLVSWPAAIKKGCESKRLIANYDFMPTFAELLNVPMPDGKDGVSFYKELINEKAPEHEFVAYASMLGPAMTTSDGWKLRYINKNNSYQLYNLNEDYKEQHDLAKDMPEKVRELANKLLKACDGNFDHGCHQFHRAFYFDNVQSVFNKTRRG